jgi:hypothetical protein
MLLLKSIIHDVKRNGGPPTKEIPPLQEAPGNPRHLHDIKTSHEIQGGNEK